VLQNGDDPSVEIEPSGLSEEKIKVYTKRDRLYIHLESAKLTSPMRKVKSKNMTTKEPLYKNQKITAYVTYTTLKTVEMRGEEQLISRDKLENSRFKLKLYGENKVQFDEIDIDRFKLKAYGENDIRIYAGKVNEMLFRSYGENELQVSGMENETLKTTIYGTGEIDANVTRRLKINCLGEGRISYSGSPVVNRGLILGETTIDSGY
jgi:hypothetical protein